MSRSLRDDPALAEQIFHLGAKGLGRREIAVKLGLTLAELEAMEADDGSLCIALARAEDAARAWWEALPREAMSLGARFNHAAWRGAMRARFGDIDAEETTPTAFPPLNIPDNGRGSPDDPDEDF